MHEGGLATLLFDLLAPDEALDRANVFDVELLAVRLLAATRWARANPACAGLSIGYFGASTGAGAALWAAAEDPSVGAVVSRGGRPDLASARLSAVESPTLLIVGGADEVVLRLNEEAAARLRCEHRLAIVRDATHLFEEPGALEAAADLARNWFVRHLGPTSTPRAVTVRGQDFAAEVGELLSTDSRSKPADDVPDELEDEMRQRAEYGSDETDEG
jgi:putative phosphoribosyl transferase